MAKQAQTGDAAKRSTDRAHKVGVVAKTGRQKTITVVVPFAVKHPKYGKYQRRETVLHVHDEKNEAGVGDRVEIAECRPLSKTKNWRLVQILARGPRGAEVQA